MTTDYTAQFQEPPVDGLPGATSTTSPSDDNISAQFQEPIPPEASTSASISTHDQEETALSKTTTEKLKDVVKKPFSSSYDDDASDHTLGNKEITSPEMAAAKEVLVAKDLKTL